MIDMTYLILVLPAILFAFWAQMRVKTTFQRFSQERTGSGMTGAQAAEAVLRANGIENITIERIGGELTDHYDPRSQVIRLSAAVYDRATVSAVGVAAHEAGHAVQYAYGYGPVRLRSAIIPVSRFGSALSWPLLILGLIFSNESLFVVGIVLFLAAVVFQLITLPVEFNASNRALEALDGLSVLSQNELNGAQSVLRAAALTYVAALAVSLAQLLRLLVLFGGNQNRRDR